MNKDTYLIWYAVSTIANISCALVEKPRNNGAFSSIHTAVSRAIALLQTSRLTLRDESLAVHFHYFSRLSAYIDDGSKVAAVL